MTLTIGSLFSGIGGLDLGLERAGLGPTLWQVEQNPYAQRVLAKHWPDAIRFDDVRTVGAHNLPAVDLIAGGFPCQDISVAGKGAGLDGERSGLWSEFARIVREIRPRYVVVENVPALLARGVGRVLGDLAAGGYDAEWDCVPAAAVGAPHLRDRLFVVAYAECELVRQQPEPESRRGGSTVARDDGATGALAHPHRAGREERHVAALAAGPRLDPWSAPARRDYWEAEPNVGRVADGVPARMDRLRCLGNAVVPQVAEFIGRVIAAREARP